MLAGVARWRLGEPARITWLRETPPGPAPRLEWRRRQGDRPVDGSEGGRADKKPFRGWRLRAAGFASGRVVSPQTLKDRNSEGRIAASRRGDGSRRVRPTLRAKRGNSRWLLAVGLLGLWLVGCGPVTGGPTLPAGVTLTVANDTTLTITVTVNGRAIGTFPAGGPYPTIDPNALPPLPWSVEARSVSGRIIASLRVDPSQAWRTSSTGEFGSVVVQNGLLSITDLSCGRLTMWVGSEAPSGPPPPTSAGSAGDCAP